MRNEITIVTEFEQKKEFGIGLTQGFETKECLRSETTKAAFHSKRFANLLVQGFSTYQGDPRSRTQR